MYFNVSIYTFYGHVCIMKFYELIEKLKYLFDMYYKIICVVTPKY